MAIQTGQLMADAVKEWHCWVAREEHFWFHTRSYRTFVLWE